MGFGRDNPSLEGLVIASCSRCLVEYCVPEIRNNEATLTITDQETAKLIDTDFLKLTYGFEIQFTQQLEMLLKNLIVPRITELEPGSFFNTEDFNLVKTFLDKLVDFFQNTVELLNREVLDETLQVSGVKLQQFASIITAVQTIIFCLDDVLLQLDISEWFSLSKRLSLVIERWNVWLKQLDLNTPCLGLAAFFIRRIVEHEHYESIESLDKLTPNFFRVEFPHEKRVLLEELYIRAMEALFFTGNVQFYEFIIGVIKSSHICTKVLYRGMKSWFTRFELVNYFSLRDIIHLAWKNASLERRNSIENGILFPLIELSLEKQVLYQPPRDLLDLTQFPEFPSPLSDLIKYCFAPYFSTSSVYSNFQEEVYVLIIRRSLRSANAMVRVNTLELLGSLKCNIQDNGSKPFDVIKIQLKHYEDALLDEAPLVRAAAIKTTAEFLHDNWDLVTTFESSRVILKIIQVNGQDGSSTLCRLKVLAALLHLASCPSAREILQFSLPSLLPLIHDTEEIVRKTFLDFSLKLCHVAGFEKFEILPQHFLLELLEGSAEVRSRSALLLFHKVFPCEIPRQARLLQCCKFIRSYPKHARILFHVLPSNIKTSSFSLVGELVYDLLFSDFSKLFQFPLLGDTSESEFSLLCLEVAVCLSQAMGDLFKEQWYQILGPMINRSEWSCLISRFKKISPVHFDTVLMVLASCKPSEHDIRFILNRFVDFDINLSQNNPPKKLTSGSLELLHQAGYLNVYFSQIISAVKYYLETGDILNGNQVASNSREPIESNREARVCALDVFEEVVSIPIFQNHLVLHPRISELIQSLKTVVDNMVEHPDSLVLTQKTNIIRIVTVYYRLRMKEILQHENQSILSVRGKKMTLANELLISFKTVIEPNSLNSIGDCILLEKFYFRLIPDFIQLGFIGPVMLTKFLSELIVYSGLDREDSNYYLHNQTRIFCQSVDTLHTLFNRSAQAADPSFNQAREISPFILRILYNLVPKFTVVSPSEDSLVICNAIFPSMLLLVRLSYEMNMIQEYTIHLVMILFQDWAVELVTGSSPDSHSPSFVMLNFIDRVLSSEYICKSDWLKPLLSRMFLSACRQSIIKTYWLDLLSLFSQSTFFNLGVEVFNQHQNDISYMSSNHSESAQRSEDENSRCFCICGCGHSSVLTVE